jgi:hypothetical protein
MQFIETASSPSTPMRLRPVSDVFPPMFDPAAATVAVAHFGGTFTRGASPMTYIAPVLGLLAGLVGIADTIPYVRDTVGGSTRPTADLAHLERPGDRGACRSAPRCVVEPDHGRRAGRPHERRLPASIRRGEEASARQTCS